PAPVSTMHTRSRSALGCGSAEITRAMVKGASALPRSATLSTSSPIMVSFSSIRSSGSSVSRCSLSHAKGNFTGELHLHPCLPFAQSRFELLWLARSLFGGSLPPCGGGTGRGVQQDDERWPCRE